MADAEETTERRDAPWYLPEFRHTRITRRTKVMLIVAGVIALVCCFSVKPLWRFAWRHHLYNVGDFWREKTAAGARVPVGRWPASRRIIVYGIPGVSERAIAATHEGMRSLVGELGLDIAVERVPLPEGARESHAYALATTGGASFDYERFVQSRLAQRGMQYAEVVVVQEPFYKPSYALGMSRFPPGVAVVREAYARPALARHEGAHLLGYNKHDDFPWLILGYREDWLPDGRDTLMVMRAIGNDALSDRARDALLGFWRGMEARDRTAYLRPNAPPAP